MCVLCVCACVCVCVRCGDVFAHKSGRRSSMFSARRLSLSYLPPWYTWIPLYSYPLDHEAKIDVRLQVAKVHSAVKVGPKIVEEMVTWAHVVNGVCVCAANQQTSLVWDGGGGLWRVSTGWNVG